ncbi:28373_t:CDS:2, partial [Gigaspora margarita]
MEENYESSNESVENYEGSNESDRNCEGSNESNRNCEGSMNRLEIMIMMKALVNLLNDLISDFGDENFDEYYNDLEVENYSNSWLLKTSSNFRWSGDQL